LLAIASKNEEATALEAIRRHPEMVLKLEDFAIWKINWRDKAVSIADIMSSLNLGMESAVFLDDSAFERARVKEALPQVLVPELPADPMQYPSFLRSLRCFDSPMISKEDRTRTKMYVADRRRSELKTEATSIGEWLETLGLSVTVEPLKHGNLDRTAQLFNKTNQMNLSTRRLTAAELVAWAETDNHGLWTFRVSDRFGEYGLCGISSLVCQGTKGWMRDFLLSCRVMGRGVEEAMLSVVAQRAKTFGCAELYAELIPSAKNGPCERWLNNNPNLIRDGNIFRLSLEKSIECQTQARIIMA
jgi:FkbH-like protein